MVTFQLHGSLIFDLILTNGKGIQRQTAIHQDILRDRYCDCVGVISPSKLHEIRDDRDHLLTRPQQRFLIKTREYRIIEGLIVRSYQRYIEDRGAVENDTGYSASCGETSLADIFLYP